MKRLLKKATAGLLTLALVAGGVPAGTINEKIDSVKEAFVAEAEQEIKELALDTTYYPGDLIKWDDGEAVQIGNVKYYFHKGSYIYDSIEWMYFSPIYMADKNSKSFTYSLRLEEKSGNVYGEYLGLHFDNYIKNYSESKKTVDVSSYYRGMSDDGIPVGIKLVSGEGTEGTPFIGQIVFSKTGYCGESATFSIDGDTVTIGGSGAIDSEFFKNYPIKSVVFAEGSNITEIGDSAFANTDLESIVLPSSLESIDQKAFSGCTSLTIVDFSNCSSLKSIGQSAFSYTGATSNPTFSACTSLQNLDFSGCTNLESIGEFAFANCSALSSVNFVGCSKLETIKGYSFAHTSISTIAIPESVMTVESCAFLDTPLSEIILLGNARIFRDNTKTDEQNIKYGNDYLTNLNLTGDFSGIFSASYQYIGRESIPIVYIAPYGSYFNREYPGWGTTGKTTKLEQKSVGKSSGELSVRSDSTIKLFASSFDEKRPTMQVVINDASRVNVNYFIPMTEGHFSADSYVVSYGGKAKDLSEASDSSDGYSGFSFTIQCAAKEIADENSIVIKDKKTGDVLFDNNGATISVASYLKQVLQSSTTTKLSNFVGRMLQYAAAAQQFFNHNTENMANEGTSWPLTFLDAVDGSAFTAEQFNAALTAAEIDAVSYYALNMSFVSDTTFLLAFKFADDCDTEEEKNASKAALESFLKENETTAFKDKVDYSIDGSGNYVVARVVGIPLLDLNENIYNFGTFTVKATDYLIKTGAESSSASANMKTLARAMWAYYNAAKTYAGV